MLRESSSINLFCYLDYRKYLYDWFEKAKTTRRGYSFRVFSRQAGFVSPNFLKRVMEGERNLTLESIPKFVIGLGLNKQEGEFFKNLVLYNQSTTHDEKNQYYQLLIKSKKFAQLKPIEKDQYDYYASWYHPVIRELVTSKQFDGTPEWLAERISPCITPQQAQKSLDLLTHLGFIKKDGDQWKQAQSLVTTGAEAQAIIMINYHQNLLKLVYRLLTEVKAANRDVSSLTLGVSKGRLPLIKKKIQEFRQEILKMVSEDADPEDVVMLTMQLFPLTKRS